MKEQMCWKSEKECSECKERIRQEIIKEMKEICECEKCNRLMRVKERDLTRMPRTK